MRAEHEKTAVRKRCMGTPKISDLSSASATREHRLHIMPKSEDKHFLPTHCISAAETAADQKTVQLSRWFILRFAFRSARGTLHGVNRNSKDIS
jgi:hypothetical protein